jgi:hypothetical protein
MLAGCYRKYAFPCQGCWPGRLCDIGKIPPSTARVRANGLRTGPVDSVMDYPCVRTLPSSGGA